MYIEVINCSESRIIIDKLTNGAFIVVKPSPSAVIYEVKEDFPINAVRDYWWFIDIL